jgi:hypothetical protein
MHRGATPLPNSLLGPARPWPPVENILIFFEIILCGLMPICTNLQRCLEKCRLHQSATTMSGEHSPD